MVINEVFLAVSVAIKSFSVFNCRKRQSWFVLRLVAFYLVVKNDTALRAFSSSFGGLQSSAATDPHKILEVLIRS